MKVAGERERGSLLFVRTDQSSGPHGCRPLPFSLHPDSLCPVIFTKRTQQKKRIRDKQEKRENIRKMENKSNLLFNYNNCSWWFFHEFEITHGRTRGASQQVSILAASKSWHINPSGKTCIVLNQNKEERNQHLHALFMLPGTTQSALQESFYW